MTTTENGVCLHHRQAPDPSGHVHRLVRCNTQEWLISSFTSRDYCHEKSSCMTKLKFVRWRRMWRKPRIINNPVVTLVSGGQLKSAHWGKTRTAVPPHFSWQRRARAARAGALRASRCGHVVRYPTVFPACEGSSGTPSSYWRPERRRWELR